MNYTISQCYKEVEKILKRPLNSNEYEWIKSWFENYPKDFIEATMISLENTRIYKASYISTTLANHFIFYKSFLKVRGESSEELTELEKRKQEEIEFNKRFDKYKI